MHAALLLPARLASTRLPHKLLLDRSGRTVLEHTLERARAAQDLIAKIADTVPERLRPFVLEPASRARPGSRKELDRIDMARTRTQIHEGKKITLRYRDEQGRDSERTIWPIAIGYHEAVRILAAWCELHRDFRSFRTDRVVDASYLDEKYPERRDLLRAKWRRSLVWEHPSDI